MALTLGTTVLSVDDFDRARAFWTAALGWIEREGSTSDDWTILDPPGAATAGAIGGSLALSVTGYPQHYPPRIHLDLYADDQQAEIERLLSLGARRIDWHDYPPDADWVVLEDTEGNRFCVVDASRTMAPSPE
ncbi:MAG: VOC family protein [Microbacterium sp.]|uniref:VOC family protein n=1 Tax=Microbacterium sp. TaxID=51671 RepID=UPI0039E5CCCA